MADTQSAIGNGVKLVGEAIVPGASEMIEGNITSGLVHAAVALGAGALLALHAPVLAGLAVLAVKANSYSRSVTGQNLLGGTIDRAMRSAANAVDQPGSRSTPSSSSSSSSRP